MTLTEASDLMQRIGCLDTRNVGCLHIAYVNWTNRKRTGEAEPVPEAYAMLVEELKKPAAVKQERLLETHVTSD